MAILTDFLHDLNPQNATPDTADADKLGATQKFVFDQIASQDYAGINDDALQDSRSSDKDETKSVQEYIHQRYYTNFVLRNRHKIAVLDFLQLMKTAHVSQMARGFNDLPGRNKEVEFGVDYNKAKLPFRQFLCVLLYRFQDITEDEVPFNVDINELVNAIRTWHFTLDLNVKAINEAGDDRVTVSDLEKFSVYFDFCGYDEDTVRIVQTAFPDVN